MPNVKGVSKNTYAFTLIELITVVIIIAILASLAVPNYIKTVERAKDKEALVNLQLICAAEKIYKLENGMYCGSYGPTITSIDEINSQLNLDLNDNNWQYELVSINPTVYFYANAIRSPVTHGIPAQYSRTFSSNMYCEIRCIGAGCP